MPDLPIVFQMLNDKLQLFRDLGGGSLHRRGYRSNTAVHKAALNEAAAAGLLLIAGWQQRCQHPGGHVSCRRLLVGGASYWETDALVLQWPCEPEHGAYLFCSCCGRRIEQFNQLSMTQQSSIVSRQSTPVCHKTGYPFRCDTC